MGDAVSGIRRACRLSTAPRETPRAGRLCHTPCAGRVRRSCWRILGAGRRRCTIRTGWRAPSRCRSECPPNRCLQPFVASGKEQRRQLVELRWRIAMSWILPLHRLHDGREKQLAAIILPCAGCRGTAPVSTHREATADSEPRLTGLLRQNSRGDVFRFPRDGSTDAQVGVHSRLEGSIGPRQETYDAPDAGHRLRVEERRPVDAAIRGRLNGRTRPLTSPATAGAHRGHQLGSALRSLPEPRSRGNGASSDDRQQSWPSL